MEGTEADFVTNKDTPLFGVNFDSERFVRAVRGRFKFLGQGALEKLVKVFP